MSLIITYQNFLYENKKNDYIKYINKEYDNLLRKVQRNPNFEFILGSDIKYNPIGEPNRCETNVYDFLKDKLSNGDNNFYPVSGFFFMGNGHSDYPVEHWWVYNKSNNKYIEVTPMEFHQIPYAYAGVKNFNINDEILKSRIIWDIDFFKGGNGYTKYFK